MRTLATALRGLLSLRFKVDLLGRHVKFEEPSGTSKWNWECLLELQGGSSKVVGVISLGLGEECFNYQSQLSPSLELGSSFSKGEHMVVNSLLVMLKLLRLIRSSRCWVFRDQNCPDTLPTNVQSVPREAQIVWVYKHITVKICPYIYL